MRFLEIDLSAYGPFTAVRLDLSPGEMGLHLIHGPNEAGKSAALRALHALLFGIHPRTKDDFVHAYKKLRIGARIRNGAGDEIAFVRRKAQSGTLLRPGDEVALPDDALHPFVGGISGEAFERIYGIGHAGLVAGGKELEAMRGLAGESLFAAGLGGATLTDALAELDRQATELRTSRGGAIRSHLAELKAARQDREQATRSFRDWELLEQTLREVETRRASLIEELAQLRTDHGRLVRSVEALGLVGERTLLLSKIEQLGDERILPESYSVDERRTAMRALDKQRPVADRLRQKLDGDGGLRRRLANLAVDEELLRVAADIDAVHENRAGHVKAADDIVKLQARRETFRAGALAILQELRPGTAWEEVESLRLPTDRKLRLQELAAEERARRSAPGELAGQLDELAVEQEHLAQRLAELPSPADPETLSRTVRRIRNRGELDEQLAKARKEATRSEAAARRGLDALGLWKGELADLDRMSVPNRETVDRFARQLAEIDDAARLHGKTTTELRSKGEEIERAIRALRSAGDVPTESVLDAARGRRQEGWALVRAAWLEHREEADAVRRFAGESALPEAYESSVGQADEVADRLRREADRVATLSRLQVEREDIVRDDGRNEDEQTKLGVRRDELLAEWRAIWAPAGVAEPLPPAEMKGWLASRESVLALAQQMRERVDAAAALAASLAGARTEGAACLEALGEPGLRPDESLSALLDRGDERVARLGQLAKRREELGNKLAEHGKTRELLALRRDRAQRELHTWSEQWAQAVAVVGCPAEATGVEVNARLTRLDDLASAVKDIADADRRIDGMQDNARQFEGQVAVLVEAVAQDLRGRPAAEAAAELAARVQRHRADARTRATLTKEEAEATERLEEVQVELDEASATLERLCRVAGVGGAEELEGREASSHALDGLQRRLVEVDRLLAKLAAGRPAEELITAAADPAALEAQAAAVQDEIDSRETERASLEQRVGELRKEMEVFDGSGAAAEADERSLGILSRIQEDADRYVRLRIASAFLNRHIERHRAATQDPILTRASELFAGLTCGSFAGLRAGRDDDDNPVVVGLRPDLETALLVEQMSDGTRDQLYLALRLAYLERQLERREPLPFIVDDILINFDDQRSRATLRLLQALSTRTQVLLFTHHDRIVDLAQEVVGPEALFVHNLRQPSAQA